jgi:cation:H+ antiporter
VAFTLLLAGFVLASAAVWFAGIRLSNATDILSMRLFGATVLAAAPSLPEVSTGLQSLKLGDYQFAVSDIFGGNAFLAVLFLPATLISGSAVLPQAHASDVYLTALAILLTIIYMGCCCFGRNGSGPTSAPTRSRLLRRTRSGSPASRS